MHDDHQEQAEVATVPDILVTPDAADVTDAAVKALAADPTLYQRGGDLVRVLRDTSPHAADDGTGIRRPLGPRIDRLPRATLLERLTTVGNWWQRKGKDVQPVLPPAWCVAAVAARGEWPGVRFLESVIEYPCLRPDGSLLLQPGYDPATGLLFEPFGVYARLKDSPTLADAREAVATLLGVAGDFPFQWPTHRSAWLAALLTPLARFAFPGVAPLFLVDSNTRGSGKGLLLHVISRIITGETFATMSYTDDVDELRKRVTSLAVGGDRLVLFDNVTGRFGNSVLDAALTSTRWTDRLLGGNQIVNVPLYASWFATANNAQIHGDTARRVCHIRLDSPEEHPERRTDFAHPDLLSWVTQNRGPLLASALTILRAFCLAGRPDLGLSAWGSFEGWSALVRQAVVWAGQPDPGETRVMLQQTADVMSRAMALLLRCWKDMDTERDGLTAAQVIHKVYKEAPPVPTPEWHPAMRDLLDEIVGKPDAGRLGYRLRTYRRRVFGGLYLDEVGKSHQAVRWAVYPASSFRPPAQREPGEEG
jgi:hypothetical protein